MMKRTALFYLALSLNFLFLLVSRTLQAQEIGNIEVTIIDSSTNEVIPFATLYNQSTGKGTLSNFSGVAVLNNIASDDLIICSYLGYEKKSFSAQDLFARSSIALKPQVNLIAEAVVLGDNSWLYGLIASLKKNKNKTDLTAKTYLELESYHDNKQIELFQGYYNAELNEYDVKKLEMKAGRFALAPIGMRFFISSETSRAFYMHRLMEESSYFPHSPLDLKKRELKKRYDLELEEQFYTEDERRVFVVSFNPRHAKQSSFSGKMWVDSAATALMKIELQIEDASIYPFESVYHHHELENVDMRIRKEYEDREGEMLVKSVDFDYSYTYLPHVGNSFDISSRAVLHCYDYEADFVLPLFDFANFRGKDYRKVNLLPFQKEFWECIDDFTLENELATESFMNSGEVLMDAELMGAGIFNEKRGMYGQLYRRWSESRIMFVGNSDSASVENTLLPGLKYNLEAQILLDINDQCDSLVWKSESIFDPYNSYYYLPMDQESLTFVNIYMDLVEIKRRELDERIPECNGDIECVKALYEEINRAKKEVTDRYLREVDRGTRRSALKNWNEVVIQKLGIDNMDYFEL